MPKKHRLNMPYVGIPTFCRFPLCEELEKLEADVAVLGIPFDEGVSWRPGMRFAPRRIREMSLRHCARGAKTTGFFHCESGEYMLERELARDRLVDCGDVDVIYTRIEETFSNITASVAAIRRAGAIPAILGGDHAITYPIVKAYTESPLDIVVIDGHLDFTDEIYGIRVAGMSPIRRASELANVRHIVQVGIRGFRNSRADWLAAQNRGNVIITAEDFHRSGADAVLSRLPPLGDVYISLDMDGLDPSVAPGVNGVEPGGLSYSEVRALLRGVTERGNVVGFDINEVNPTLDTSDYTALVAAQLTIELIGAICAFKKAPMKR